MNAIVCPLNPPGHDWQAGLSCRWCDATRTPSEAVLSGLASVRGWSREAARAVRDAYRAEVLAEAKTEVVAWLVKKAAEGNDPIESLASKVDRGAVRIFLGTGHYRDAMDAHRAEVRTEDARLIEDAACDADWTRTPDYCAGLRAGAELLLANTGQEATAAAATATPGFFQPGHTYTEISNITDWRFRCGSITTHPEDGERTAIGWRHFRGEWEPYAYGEDDWEIHRIVDHIDVTEAGDGRG